MQEKESNSGVQWRKENLNPRVHRSSGKLGEPRFPLERVDPRVEIFLSPLTTHDGFNLSILVMAFSMKPLAFSLGMYLKTVPMSLVGIYFIFLHTR